MEGVIRDDRLVCAYVANDLGGAWARDDFGNYDFPCEPGGEQQRELAFRLGVNLVMYALCLDYKSDQVHVPFIMRRRRWKPDDGARPAPRDAESKPVSHQRCYGCPAVRARRRRASCSDARRAASRAGARTIATASVRRRARVAGWARSPPRAWSR